MLTGKAYDPVTMDLVEPEGEFKDLYPLLGQIVDDLDISELDPAELLAILESLDATESPDAGQEPGADTPADAPDAVLPPSEQPPAADVVTPGDGVESPGQEPTDAVQQTEQPLRLIQAHRIRPPSTNTPHLTPRLRRRSLPMMARRLRRL